MKCSFWDDEHIKSERKMYNMSVDINDFNLLDFEKEEFYSFIPSFNLPSDYVQFTKEESIIV